MAQLNVLDSWWADPRRTALGRALNNQELADGIMLNVWRCAQAFHQKQQGIPLGVWRAFPSHEVIAEIGLARVTETGVYVSGSTEAFAWLDKKRKSGATGGKASGETRRSKTKQTEAKRSKTKQTEANASKTNPISISISIPNTNKTEDTPATQVGEQVSPPTDLVRNLGNQKPPARGNRTETQNDRIRRFVAAYVKAYKTRFGEGARPEDLSDPKVRGQIAQFAADHPDVDRACELVQVYFQTEENWFRTKGWDFITFRNNLSVLGQARESGSPSGINWKKLEAEIRAENEKKGKQ